MTPRPLAVVLVALLAGACASGRATSSGAGAAGPTAPLVTPSILGTSTTSTIPRVARSADPATTTTGTPAAATVRLGPCEPAFGRRASVAPASFVANLRARAAALDTSSTEAGVSIWVDGYGEIVAHGADRALRPASNEKILTALGALDRLGAGRVLHTSVRAETPVQGGVLAGNLFLVAGGDPTLASSGHHSLDGIARRVAATGLRAVQGDIVVDESHHERARSAPGWPSWIVPRYAGPLSALMVDDNRGRADAAFLAEPAIEHARTFARALERHGVDVAGVVRPGVAPPAGVTLVTLPSPPVSALVQTMLRESDNEVAELLAREIGTTATVPGTTAAGARLIGQAARARCGALSGVIGDGSGMSVTDRWSARDLRRLLHAARRAPWAETFLAGLPIAARTGTLEDRFAGTAAAGNVRAKTGSIIGGKALSGYLTTAGGRDAVFAIVVNGDGSSSALDDIDALVVALALMD